MIAIGLVLLVPYVAGNLIGARIFNPELERTYRRVAYVIVATSAIVGLPIWG